VRPDGSWPIDSNLSTWVTTLSINALSDAGENLDEMAGKLRRWLLDQQSRSLHPFTSAAPGGWGWTPLPGAVPDADDTAGALLALKHLGVTTESRGAAQAGIPWLLDLQNHDGGWPTFCRGWGYLPFDRSSADITAHALRALHAWEATCSSDRIERAQQKGLQFLNRQQRSDGSWLPLWFGNQHAADDENPTYGTARVLAAYRDLDQMDSEPARRAIAWLLEAQNPDGGWGGACGTPSSIEETALAVDVLLAVKRLTPAPSPARGGESMGGDSVATPVSGEGRNVTAVNNGLAWLVEQVEAGGLKKPTPIGFYFAKLWYFEKLYPIIFTVGALGRARRSAARL
jgi:squalene-hopene/tetraprenyl-beta-curcumene cyclase